MRIAVAGIVVVLLAAGLVLLYVFPRPVPPWPEAGGPGAAPAPADPASWPNYRGGPQLTGAASGKLTLPMRRLWRFKTGGAVKSSAAIEGGRVFVGSDDGRIYALSLTDGGKLWDYETGGAVESSPCVADGRVFAGSADGSLYCLDAASGKLQWTCPTDAEVNAPVNVVRLGGGKTGVLAGSFDAKLYCADAADGEILWTCQTDESLYGAAAVASGTVVFGGRDGILRAVRAADGGEILATEVGPCIPGSIALSGGKAYVALYGGEFKCFDLARREVLWTYATEAEGFFSSPAVAGGKVFVGGRDGRLHCIGPDGKGVWTFAARDHVDSSPVVCDGKVVFGSSDGRLYVVALADGKELWSYDIGGPITASPAVAAARVIVGCEDGYVYAFAGRRE